MACTCYLPSSLWPVLPEPHIPHIAGTSALFLLAPLQGLVLRYPPSPRPLPCPHSGHPRAFSPLFWATPGLVLGSGALPGPFISSGHYHHSQDNHSHQIPCHQPSQCPVDVPRGVTPQMRQVKTELTILPGAAPPAAVPLDGLSPLPGTPSPHRTAMDGRPFTLQDSRAEMVSVAGS